MRRAGARTPSARSPPAPRASAGPRASPGGAETPRPASAATRATRASGGGPPRLRSGSAARRPRRARARSDRRSARTRRPVSLAAKRWKRRSPTFPESASTMSKTFAVSSGSRRRSRMARSARSGSTGWAGGRRSAKEDRGKSPGPRSGEGPLCGAATLSIPGTRTRFRNGLPSR